MAFKFVVFAAFVAVARSSAIGYAAAPLGITSYAAPLGVQTYTAASPVVSAAPLAVAAPVARAVVANPPAQYDYGYSVSDPLTGDHKSAVESRRGDVVQGSYSLVDSDGTKRTVDYSADSVHGFNAVVSKQPLAVAAQVAVAAPVAVATPALAHTYAAAPALAHTYAAAPALSYAASAPALSYAHNVW